MKPILHPCVVASLVLAPLLLTCSAVGQNTSPANPQGTTVNRPAQTSATTPDQAVAASGEARTRRVFDIDIAGGQLSMAWLRTNANPEAIWSRAATVDATVGNLAKYICAGNPELNIVVTPGAADLRIPDMKLRSVDLSALSVALAHATEGVVRGTMFGGSNNWTFATQSRPSNRVVEVFNLSGHVGTLEKEAVRERLEEIKSLIFHTLEFVKRSDLSSEDLPDFTYHEGTSLLIVIGNPSAIEVSRKVVNALPGQQNSGSAVLDARPTRDQN
jgi:hypothetical protein